VWQSDHPVVIEQVQRPTTRVRLCPRPAHHFPHQFLVQYNHANANTNHTAVTTSRAKRTSSFKVQVRHEALTVAPFPVDPRPAGPADVIGMAVMAAHAILVGRRKERGFYPCRAR